ncbi:hypothetical protein BASA60_011270 [Batrachochytrium salamandrivorans]|nr:hypothetical protein BASA60_011270 [Batrachochytrium salamandrivorans]
MGEVAHRVIGLIAKQFLTKEGLEYVDAYLHQQSMDSIGSWADNDRESYRGPMRQNIISPPPWIPLKAKCVYDDHRDCADGICLSSAIARHNKILMESTSPDDPGAEESLKYIIHYVSDVCQPLHTDGRVDMQISKAGLRVAKWLNDLARLHSQTKVEAATLPAAQPGKSNIEKHPSSPHESMPQSKKGPSMSSKQLVSGAQKPDDPPPPQSDHDDHQVADDDATEWQVVKKKAHVLALPPPKGKGATHQKEKKGATRQSKQ